VFLEGDLGGVIVTMSRVKSLAVPFALALLSGCGSHMQHALDDLRSAREQLIAAEPNKGGHREKAIEDVDRAIEQVKKGMEFAGQPVH
jgi:hypothetical protein